VCRKPHVGAHEKSDVVPPMKPIATRRKPPVHHELIEDQEQPGWPETDGMSGEGAESALAHLRDQESKRIDRSGKGE
jgi:hypothetical protein